ncbi:MAG TPA: hypothetical protein VIF62_30705 [Labilithrix sp.]
MRSIASRLAAYEKTSKQRAELALDAARLHDRVADAARRAGVDAPDPALRVDAPKEARIHRFVADRATLGERLDAARIELARAERELARLRPSGEAVVGEPSDLDTLRAAIERARPHAALEGKHASDVARVTKRRAAIDADAAAIGLFTGEAAALAALRVPAIASVERLAARAADAERAASQAAMRAADLDAQTAAVERQLAEHSGDFAPPDTAALRAVREARDAAWHELDASSVKARGAYERTVRDADDVADRMIREADRVTTIARLRELARTYTKQRDDARVELARIEKERAAHGEELRALFEPIAPLGFAEMRAWLERRERIVERFEELREAEREIEETSRAIAAAKEELVALGLDGERLAEQIAHASLRLAAAETASRDSAAAARLEEQLEERRAAIAKDEAALADVRTKLAELVAPLGVPEDASGDEIARALEAVRDLFRAVDERAHAEARAELAANEARQFEEEVARAVRELGTDLDGVSAREAALALAQRADRAAALTKDVADADAQLDGAEPVPEDLARLASDPEAADRAVDELDVTIADLGDAVSRLDQQIGGLRSGLDRMRADSGAADASAAAQEALARVRSYVETWARTKLAAVLLQREIERYREENQGPLLTRASQLFARLTANAFSGVRAGFDDHDRAALTCVRAGGVEVGVEGLSQGTRDQLYLALRLASLLRHAEISGPMPVVLDDILIHFDDERSRAALVVLGEVAREMQIVFFTHHARLVELAKDALGAAVTIHELSPPAATVDQRQWM